MAVMQGGLVLLVVFSFLVTTVTGFDRKVGALKGRLDNALGGHNQEAVQSLVGLFDRGDFGTPGSVGVLLLGTQGRAAARAFAGPSSACYDLTNTSMPSKSSDQLREDIARLASRCKQPCEAVIIVEHAERLQTGRPLNPLLPVVDDKGLVATLIVLYEADDWALPEKSPPEKSNSPKVAIREMFKKHWTVDQFNADAFLGRFNVVAFDTPAQGTAIEDTEPICTGQSSEVATTWPGWVKWSTRPTQLITIVSGVLVVLVVHWSMSTGVKKATPSSPSIFTGPRGGGGGGRTSPPPASEGARGGGSPKPSVPQTPITKQRGGATTKPPAAEGGGGGASTGESVPPDVWRSPRLAAKTKKGPTK